MNSRRKFWLRFSGAIFTALVILLTPYKSTTSPEWRIQVVDEGGRPIGGLHVAEEWSYFGIDLAPGIDSLITDSQGRVVFPPRTIWASLASRLLNPQGASERLGPSVWVLACDEAHHMQGEFFWNGSRFMPTPYAPELRRLMAKPVKYCTMM